MTTQPPRDALAVPDLRGIDAGPIEEWLDLRKRGQVPRDADYVLVSDLSKVVAQNLHLAAQPSAQEPAQSLPTAPKFANVDWVRDGIANFIADNWPDRKHSLAEIEAGVRAIEINPPKASLLPLPAEPADSLGNLTERCGYNSGACTRRGCVGGCQALACMQDASTLHDLCELLMHDCDETDANYMAAGRAKGSIATDYIRSVVLKACKPASEAPEPNEQTEGALPHEAALREALGELVRVLSKRPPDTVMKAERQLDDVAAALVRAKAVLSQGAKL